MASALNPAHGGAQPIWRPSSPETIDDDVAALWRELARDGAVSRALMSNLVVVRSARAAGADGGGDGGAAVAARHPARTILLTYAPAVARLCGPTSARVGVLVVGAPPSRYGVELIDVEAECGEASLPSIMRRLLIGSVPTTLWWTGDVSRQAPPPTMIALARQLVYDSASWTDVRAGLHTVAAIGEAGRSPGSGPRLAIDLADLNWRRLAPMRRVVNHLLHDSDTERAMRGRARIRHSRGHGALAWLLAGWLREQLNSPPSADAPLVEEGGDGPAVLSAVFPDARGDVTASMLHDGVTVTGGAMPHLAVAVRRESEAEAVAEELHNLAHDTRLRGALRALVALFQRS